MSGSRKDFDVKQILKIRWRWFGHQAAPASAIQQGDFLSGDQSPVAGDRKFLDSSNLNLPLQSVEYRRMSNQGFQNLLTCTVASTSEHTASSSEPAAGASEAGHKPETEDGGSEEDIDSESSSCRSE